MKCFAVALFAAAVSAKSLDTDCANFAKAKSFSYNYDKAGADWGCVCKSGKEQSPIDIVTKDVE